MLEQETSREASETRLPQVLARQDEAEHAPPQWDGDGRRAQEPSQCLDGDLEGSVGCCQVSALESHVAVKASH